MKRWIAVCLLAAMVIALLPFRTMAAENTESAKETYAYMDGEKVIAEEVVAEEVISEASMLGAEVETLTKLGTPTELKWGIDDDWVFNEETGDVDLVPVEMPGSMSWKTAEPDQGQADIEIFRADTDELVGSAYWTFGSTEIPEWRAVDSFNLGDYDSGTYYFTVTSKGDGTQYSDSDTARSENWTYVRPEAQVGSCSGLTWNWPEMSWNGAEDAGGYEIEFLFAKTLEDEPNVYQGSWYYTDPADEAEVLTQTSRIMDDTVAKHGTGYYYFRVRALSPDITRYCNGPWTELSEPYNVTEVVQTVDGQLNDILESASTPEEMKEAVQAMDTEELRSAMLADNTNSGTVATIETMEMIAGGTAGIQVSEDAAAFDAEQISVVGATLNDKQDASGDVTLVIDKPAKENVIPAQYDNSVAVKFSMNLENVKDPENLEVPVKITLPIPEKINPSFLVIIHYRVDGTMEEIWPYVYRENGQYYASFVLTSFSDFTMTQTSAIPVYRLYNPYTQEHLLTGEEEKDALVQAGWSLDGIAWNAPTSGIPVYRLYNPYGDFHFYSTSQEEIDSLTPLGWTVDGAVSFSATAETGSPVYRLFNPYAETNYHLFTASQEERDWLASLGWKIEGVAWYCAKD